MAFRFVINVVMKWNGIFGAALDVAQNVPAKTPNGADIPKSAEKRKLNAKRGRLPVITTGRDDQCPVALGTIVPGVEQIKVSNRLQNMSKPVRT